MSLTRVLISVALACCVALAPCLAPAREHRSLEVKHEFQRQHPCPSTGRTTGACPGYIKDHIVPLACGGLDSSRTCNGRQSPRRRPKTGGSGKAAVARFLPQPGNHASAPKLSSFLTATSKIAAHATWRQNC